MTRRPGKDPGRPPRAPHRLPPVCLVVGVLALLAAASFGARDDLYTSLASAGSGPAVAPAVALLAEAGLLVLVGTTALLAGWSWRRDRRSFLVLVAAGVGVVGSYVASELVKLLVQEQRPCRVLDLGTALRCPALGDWSWPSNHATIAGAFAAACVLAAARTAWLVVPVAVLVATSRVAAGVHYVHDVLAGLALGVLGVGLAVAAASRLSASATAARASRSATSSR